MKRLVNFFAILSLAMFACSFPGTLTPTSPPLATETLQVTEPPVVTEAVTEAPTAAGPVLPAPNVTCHELLFYLDPALASSTTCEIIPEQTMEMDTHPQYTTVTLLDYPLQDKFFPATISVFPVQPFTILEPDFLPTLVTDLQTLIAGGLPGEFSLPFLPIFNAAQTFHSQYAPMPFVNGDGIRFLTLYAQYSAPLNNQDLFYTYQGLTPDGLYWISAILPINHVILPETADPPPGGMTWEQFSANYDVYLPGMVSQLEAQLPDSFTPTLTMLDALISSISIQP